MSYELHITRREHWANAETADISLDEWLSYVDSDGELELTNGYNIKIGSETEFQNRPGYCEWNAHPTEKELNARPWFSYWKGNIDTKNPDAPTIRKMMQIASALDAHVQGDDGELYTEEYLTEKITPTQESENMEVHKHPHHVLHKKRWPEYLLEFFMLFLAVFLGFLAENQREHYVEHQREKKFARRLLSDLRQDSIFFVTRIKVLEERQIAYKQFLETMTNMEPAADWAVMRSFVPLLTETSNDFTTATYNQMKTSGTLRYIDNDSLTTSLQKYYDVLLAKASRDSEGADKFFADYIISYMTKHFRFQDFRANDGSSQQIKLLNRSAESDQELINIMGIWASNCDTQLNLQRPAQEQMSALVKLIKKEYRLD